MDGGVFSQSRTQQSLFFFLFCSRVRESFKIMKRERKERELKKRKRKSNFFAQRYPWRGVIDPNVGW
jgi:hypothetical protein